MSALRPREASLVKREASFASKNCKTYLRFTLGLALIGALCWAAASQAAQVAVIVGNAKLGVLGVFTLVREPTRGPISLDLDFFDSNGARTMTVQGCEPTSVRCLPGIAATSTTVFNQALAKLQSQHTSKGFFGTRLTGAPGDLAGTFFNAYAGTPNYSVQLQPQDPASGGLGYAALNSLAVFAKAQAQINGCMFTCANDDSSTNNACSPITNGDNSKFVKLNNRTLGTVASPKICYVEFPFGYGAVGPSGPIVGPGKPDSNSQIRFEGTTNGAGVLVIKGEMGVRPGHTLTYDGLVVIVGPEATAKFVGSVTIRGGVILGTSEPYCLTGACTEAQLGYYMNDLVPSGSGSVRYQINRVQSAEALLAGWTP